MKFDDLLEYIGEMGPYQNMVFILACMVSVLGVDAIAVNFVAGYMDHWCKVDGLTEFPHEQQKYIAIPSDQDGVYSTCDMYAVDYTNYTNEELWSWNRTERTSNVTDTVACTDWVYDQTEFVSTSMNKFDLVCAQQDLVPLVSTLFMAGILVGSIMSGPLSDRIGRKPTFMIFVVIKLGFGMMSTFATNYATFAVARVFVGLGTFSSYLVAYVLVLELVGPMYRTYVGVGFGIAYSIGMMLLSGMAYAIRDDKWLQLAYLLPYTLLLLYWWMLPESPRWLLLRHRNHDAARVLQRMSEVNRRNLPANFDVTQLEREDDISIEHATVLDLFRKPNLRIRSIIIDCYWFTVNLIYYALSFNIGALSGSVFTNTVISAAVEIPANILCIFLCNWKRTGRRLTCSISMLLAGVVCFIRIALIVKEEATADTALCFVGRALVTVGFSGIYVYASEVFPTEARNAGLSFAAVFSQISGMISPYVGGPLSRVWEPLPALIFGVLSIAAGASVLYLPETLGQPLFETVAEAENFTGDEVPDYGSISEKDDTSQTLEDKSNLVAAKKSYIHTNKGFVNPGFVEFSTKL